MLWQSGRSEYSFIILKRISVSKHLKIQLSLHIVIEVYPAAVSHR